MMFANGLDVNAAQMSKVTFDAEYYYNTYSDLQGAIGNDASALYNHYIQHGLKEGRSGSAEFNCKAYVNNYADLRNAFGNDIAAYCNHYEQLGKNEGRNASVQFDSNANFADEIMRNGSIAQEPAAQQPVNQQSAAEKKGLSFDAEYYYNANPDLQAAIGKNAETLRNHYLQNGLKEGRSGSAEFNCKIYMNNYADLRNAFGDDIAAYCNHYEQMGKNEGRNASSQIDPNANFADEIMNRAFANNTSSAQAPAATNYECISDKYGYKAGDTMVLNDYINVTYQGADIWLDENGGEYSVIRDHGNGMMEFVQGRAAKPGEQPVSERMGYKKGDSIFNRSLGYNFNRIYDGNDRWHNEIDKATTPASKYNEVNPNKILLATLYKGELIFSTITD